MRHMKPRRIASGRPLFLFCVKLCMLSESGQCFTVYVHVFFPIKSKDVWALILGVPCCMVNSSNLACRPSPVSAVGHNSALPSKASADKLMTKRGGWDVSVTHLLCEWCISLARLLAQKDILLQRNILSKGCLSHESFLEQLLKGDVCNF